MREERLLGTQEYISELMQKGKIEDRPYIKGYPELDPIYLVERNELFFIARQCFGYQKDSESDAFIRSNFKLVYFPTNVRHAEIFANSYVKRGGPQYTAPGSVAVLECSETQYSLTLGYLQYCFIQGSPPELTRSLASKYMGARFHLLQYFFQMDSISKVNMINLNYAALHDGNRKALEEILCQNENIKAQFRKEKFMLFRKEG